MTALANFAKLTGKTESQAAEYAKMVRYLMNERNLTMIEAVAFIPKFAAQMVAEAKAGKLNGLVADSLYAELRTRGRRGLA